MLNTRKKAYQIAQEINQSPKKTPLDHYLDISNNNTFRSNDYGKSKYDDYLNLATDINTTDENSISESINESRAQNQGWGTKASAGVARATTKAAVEIAKLVPTVTGILASPFADEGEGWETAFNNSGHKALNALNETINEELLPVYVKKSVKEGGLLANLTSIDFWATEGADGIGYMAAMFAPGVALKALGGANKFKSILGGFEKGRNFMQKAANLGLKADEIGITLANTVAESGAEAGGAMQAMDDAKSDYIKGYIAQGNSPEEAEQMFVEQKARIGRDTFVLNMGLLAGTNFMNTKMLGLAGESATKKAGNIVLRDADGKLVDQVVKRTPWARTKDVPKKFGKMLLNEGLIEEGTQTTIENTLRDNAKKGELTNNFFGDTSISELGSEYIDMLTTTEGQKAIALGGILGYGATAIRSAKQLSTGKGTDTDQEIERVNDLLSKGKEAVNLFFAKVDPDVYKRSEEIDPITGENKFVLVNGKKVVDPVKRDALFLNAKIVEEDAKLWDYALENNDINILNLLQHTAESRMISSFIADSQDGLNILSEHLKDNETIPEDRKKSIMKKAEAVQKSHEQFISYSQPVLNLKNDKAIKEDIQQFYNMLTSINFKNALDNAEYSKILDESNNKVNDLLSQHGLDKTVLENESLRNQLAQKDMRFIEALYNQDFYKSKLNRIKEDNLDLWNPKKQKEAFDKLIEENNKTRERNSEENITAANSVAEALEKASTIAEVDTVLNGDIDVTITETNDVITNGVITNETTPKLKEETEFEQKLLAEQITKKLKTTVGNKQLNQLEINSLKDTVQYLNDLLSNTVGFANKDIENLIKQINQYLILHNSNSKKNTKKGQNALSQVELLNADIKNIYQLLNDIQNRIKTLQIQKEELEASRKYLDYKIEYYKKLLNQNLDFKKLDNKINQLKNKKSKLDKLINSLSKSIDKLLDLIKDIFNFISKTENELSEFKNKTDFKLLTSEELKDAILNDNAEVYSSLKNNYDKQVEKLNDLLDHAEINDEIYDKKLKELNDLYSKVQSISTQLDILQNLLIDDELKINDINEETEIVEEAKIEITKKHKRPNTLLPQYKRPIDAVDPQTAEVIQQIADEKKEKIVTENKEKATVANNITKEQIENFELPDGVIEEIDGQIYDFINDIRYSNREDYVKKNNIIFEEELPVDLDIHELDVDDLTDESTDKSEDIEKVQSTEEVLNESETPQTFPDLGVLGIDIKEDKDGNILSYSFSKYVSEKFLNFINNFKSIKNTTVSFEMPTKEQYASSKNDDAWNAPTLKAVELFNRSNEIYSDEELNHMYKYLPIKITINNDKDNFTFIPSINLKQDFESARFKARKNIVDAIIKHGYENVTSKIAYQKGGTFRYDKTNITDNNKITSLKEFEGKLQDIPLYIVKNEKGEIYDEKANIISNSTQFPTVLSNAFSQKGYVYTVIHSPGGIATPVKLNTRKLSSEQADLVIRVYGEMNSNNSNNPVKWNQHSTPLTFLSQDLQNYIETNFEKELNIFKDKNKITVAEFMTLFIHDNVNYEGGRKQYTTKYQGNTVIYGTEGTIDYTDETKNEEFKNFLTTQKRQNTVLSYLSGSNTNVNKEAYKEYLLNDVTSVNIDTQQPFKGDINVYVSSKVDISESNQEKLENNAENTLISENKDISLKDNIMETKGIKPLEFSKKKKTTNLENKPPQNCK